MYKIMRFAPYFILIILGIVFIVLYNTTSGEQFKIVFINLASSSFFVVFAYFFYDLIKSHIEKRESKYIDSYIRNQISHDVFIVLYALKKYLHGYNLESNTVKNIFAINSYSKDQILEACLNEVFVGQNGDLGVHGFGLGSHFYFDRKCSPDDWSDEKRPKTDGSNNGSSSNG